MLCRYTKLMNMKRFATTFTVITAGLLAVSTLSASEPSKLLPTQAEFVLPIDSTKGNHRHYLTVSEQSGIALLNEQHHIVAHIAKKAEHLDFRFRSNSDQQGVLVSQDKNTGEILLIGVDLQHNKLSVNTSLPASKTAYDAFCLRSADHGFELFTVDVLGDVAHWSINQSDDENWQLFEINNFAAGPNMKSCAVDETTNSLLITEENIGVWRYPTDPEKELIRELTQLPKGLQVEYIDTSSTGDIAIVSPDSTTLFLLNVEENSLEPIALNQEISPKTVQLARLGSTLTANIFDENSAKNIVTKINRLSTKQRSTKDVISSLPAYAQTQPVTSYGDAADDPEIWVNQLKPEASLIYATDKKNGLNIYDLSGKQIKALPVGRVNNVDIRYDIDLDGKKIDIAAASNRTHKSISLFSIDKVSGLPKHITDIQTDLADPYGLCLSTLNNILSIWINDTDGRFQQYQVDISAGQLQGKKIQEWQVPSQPEGCVSDDNTQRLFYGEESTGVWLKHIGSHQPDTLVASLNPAIEADIEGMSLYTLNGKSYLIVSSQGNNRYAVFAIDDNYKFLGVFKIGTNWQQLIDGASETDGLATTSSNLGSQLPNGLLVVQDGHNVMPKSRQNFKLVDGALLRNWIVERIE